MGPEGFRLMFLARIVGRVVSTMKQDTLAAVPLQWLQPVNAAGEAKGAPIVAADTFGLGPGELCYYITAREASIASMAACGRDERSSLQ